MVMVDAPWIRLVIEMVQINFKGENLIVYKQK